MGRAMTGRLFKIVAFAGFAFAGAAVVFSAPTLILLMNGMLLSVSSGVVVAYAPVIAGALSAPFPTRGDYLVTGIFSAWLATFFSRLLSIVARDFGHPELYNSHVMTAITALGLLGGFCHLWAPNAVEGRVPRERWITTGILVSIGLFIAFALWSMRPMDLPHPAIELR